MRALATSSSVAVVTFFLSVSTALACQPMPIGGQSPEGRSILSVDEAVFVESADSEPVGLYSELTSESGATVAWGVEEVEWLDDVFLASPIGGWELGDYTAPNGNVILTIVDELPDERVIERVSWSGSAAFPNTCSGTGVWLAFDGGNGLLKTWFEDATFEGRPDGFAFQDSAFVEGVRVGEELGVRTFDSTGSFSDTVLTQVSSCEGCSGSMSGESSGSLSGLGVLLGLGLLRRRRSTRRKPESRR